MENKEMEVPKKHEMTGHKLPAPKRCELDPAAINMLQFAGMRNNMRMINRRGESLMVDATLRCTTLCNLFFKFIAANPGKIEEQSKELGRLDKQWKNWLVARSDKYVYAESHYFFLEKIHFMMGDSETIAAEIEKIKSSEKLES